MSDAIRELHEYLAKSPSVVYPEDVLAYLHAIEAESAALERRIDELCVEVERLHAERDAWKLNAARLRGQNDEIVKLAKLLWQLVPKPNCEWDMDANLCTGYDKCHGECGILGDMRKLGIEVPE